MRMTNDSTSTDLNSSSHSHSSSRNNYANDIALTPVHHASPRKSWTSARVSDVAARQMSTPLMNNNESPSPRKSWATAKVLRSSIGINPATNSNNDVTARFSAPLLRSPRKSWAATNTTRINGNNNNVTGLSCAPFDVSPRKTGGTTARAINISFRSSSSSSSTTTADSPTVPKKSASSLSASPSSLWRRRKSGSAPDAAAIPPLSPAKSIIHRPSCSVHASASSSVPDFTKGSSARNLYGSTLGQSKVLQSRLDKSATVLQKHARRYLQRHALAQLQQCAVQARAIQHRIQAAIKIQSCIRRYRAQQVLYIRVLQCQLACIYREHAYEMQDIETWKQAQYKSIRKQIKRHDVQQTHDVQECHEAVQTLRDCNKTIRNQNEELQQSCQSLAIVNASIETNLAQVQENIAVLQDYILEAQEQSQRYLDVLNQFEQRAAEYEAAIARHDVIIDYETTTSSIYRRYLDLVKEGIRQSKRCESQESKEILLSLCQVA